MALAIELYARAALKHTHTRARAVRRAVLWLAHARLSIVQLIVDLMLASESELEHC